MKKQLLALVGLGLLVLGAGTPQALAWGCDGHQAVAMVAERLLSPAIINALKAVLAASPIDPAIKPYCPPLPLDPIADAATWADDMFGSCSNSRCTTPFSPHSTSRGHEILRSASAPSCSRSIVAAAR